MGTERYNSQSALARDRARRRRAMELKKKRRRQVFIRKCVLTALGFILVAGLVNWCVAGKDKLRQESNLVETETFAVAADGNVNQRDVHTPKIKYAVKSNNYVEVTDESIFSPYMALLQVESGEIIAGRSCDARIYPASMTKVMTLLVVVENIDFSLTYTFPYDILNELYLDEATVAGFEEDETVGVDDLLYGLILPSGGDAAIALARLTSGSEEEFAVLMNKKCDEMGLKNTHFANATGLHDNNQYTTPVEMAMIMEAAMSNPVCAKYLSTYEHTTAITPQHPEGINLVSTMFSRMYGDEEEGVRITAGKTGYTDQALHCLVSFAQKNGKHYIAVEAGAQDKWYTIFDSFAMYGDYAN